MHKKGYVHMDVKAANIFVDFNRRWLLGDFGSCKLIDDKITSSTFMFCYENTSFQKAHPKYDLFMLMGEGGGPKGPTGREA